MKMPRTRRSLALIAIASIATAPLAAQQEVDNVAAFARLYGVARWFYPSDAAAALDWNRFAVHGVSRAKSARTPAELERTLEELFTPLGPGIEIGAALPPKRSPGNRDKSLIAWRYRGAGFAANWEPYTMKRTNRATPDPFTRGELSQSVRADTLRGKTIRLRGHVRVADAAAQGWAGLWVRVDRSPQGWGFLDNMRDRPASDTAWREYVIEGPVAPDATRIVFGAHLVGPISVDVDAMELAVRSEDGSWSPLAIADASFETEGSTAWSQSGNHVFTRPTSAPAKGERFARMAPALVGTSAPEPQADTLEIPVAGASVDFELTRGLRARMPLSLTDAEARILSPELPALAALRAAVATVAYPRGRDDVDVRLADALVAWNVFRHFYPYWMDIAVDWDARLQPHLAAALDAAGGRDAHRDAHRDAVRALVADVRDGHGYVTDNAAPPNPPPLARLPLQLRIVGEKLVVTASSDAGIPVGSVVIAMDGVPAEQRVAKELSLPSGTLQWRRSRAEDRLSQCRRGVVVNLTIEAPSGAHAASLPCTSRMVTESRPDTIAELQPGIWYVDLTRLRAASLGAVLQRVANAKAVVFEMRGYPTDIGKAILPHLMSVAEDSTDRWMHVSRIVAPFGQSAGWQSFSWSLKPAAPHITARRVFLTNGRAISYAESVMGYVRDHQLGTIVGGPTAGANGDVVQFAVPGGFSISFTGLRVTRHDGRTPFHMSGVGPDILIEPTLAGIRAGRDEVLEGALSFLRRLP